jgi:threonine dehydrogenase-like Zn-dependent dehydrogenase
LIAAAALALGPAGAPAGDDAPNVRHNHNPERFAVARALGGAARALGHPECQALLDEFADGSGRPLRAALQASGLSAPEYLGGVLFYDSPPPLCVGSALAVTKPGSRAVLVCGSRFVRQAERIQARCE